MIRPMQCRTIAAEFTDSFRSDISTSIVLHKRIFPLAFEWNAENDTWCFIGTSPIRRLFSHGLASSAMDFAEGKLPDGGIHGEGSGFPPFVGLMLV